MNQLNLMEFEKEDRIIDLNNELVNQIEVGKQKIIYINQLQEQVERLRCCGNCKFIDGIYCNQDDKGQLVVNNWHYCDNWQSDNLTQKERET
jgi:hypothetical protein